MPDPYPLKKRNLLNNSERFKLRRTAKPVLMSLRQTPTQRPPGEINSILSLNTLMFKLELNE
jgi:hypothetical protein